MEVEDASLVVGCCRGCVALPLNPIIRLDREIWKFGAVMVNKEPTNAAELLSAIGGL